MIDLALLVLIAAPAAARIFRALVIDSITYKLRNWVGRLPEFYQEGFHCPWCLGFWISGALVLTGLHAIDSFTWWGLIAGTFATSYIQARLQDSETD